MDFSSQLETVTLRAEAPKNPNYQSPTVLGHLEEDGESLPTLPFDSSILLEEVDPVPSPLGERVYGLPHIVIRDILESRKSSGKLPLTDKAPPSVGLMSEDPAKDTNLSDTSRAQDASPRFEVEADDSEGE